MKTYAVIFKDGTSIDLDEQRGEIIKQAWLDGKKVPFEVNGNGYLVSDIKRVKQVSRHDKTEPSHQLKQGKRCIGRKSIQLEISMRIRREHGKEWPAPMRDSSFRETYRLEILEESDEKWCDFKAGTCVCYDRTVQDGHKWADVFPEGVA